MKVEVEIPDPPEGWVYDGHRSANAEEMIFNGRTWMRWTYDAPSKWISFVAVKKPEPWQPPKEIVDAILLLFGDGWIFRDGNTFWTLHKPMPRYRDDDDGNSVQLGWTTGDRHRVLNVRIPADIDWKDSVFKIGDPQQ